MSAYKQELLKERRVNGRMIYTVGLGLTPELEAGKDRAGRGDEGGG